MAKVAPIDDEECKPVVLSAQVETTAPPSPLKTWLRGKPSRCEPARAAVRRFLHGRTFFVASMVALLLALFLRDIFVLGQVPTNVESDVLLTCVFVLFALEIFGLSLVEASYPMSCFFWMDLIGTVSMIFDVSYLLGADATQPVRVGDSNGSENFVVVRAARATKLGARAGRLSRVLKLLRFMPFLRGGKDGNAGEKMAKVISNQLTNVLSTRIAGQAILLVVMLPLFSIFIYPISDDSMGVWAELLARDVMQYRAGLANTTADQDMLSTQLKAAVSDFSDFYSTLGYGPFEVCYGELVHGTFRCKPDILAIPFEPLFPRPRRNESVWEVTHGDVRVSYDLSTPRQEEAAAAIGVILFILLTMGVFGLLMSSSIGAIALQPLERMLSVVRERCAQIFKYTDDLKADFSDETSEQPTDVEQTSEFMLLEKVVAKLAAIAHLSSTTDEVEVKENMSENEVVMMGWMQGTQGTTARNGLHNSGPVDFLATTDSLPRAITRPLGTTVPQEILESIMTDDFDTLDLRKELRASAALYLLTAATPCGPWVCSNVPEQKLLKFVARMEERYVENHFHNFAHGVDVLHSVALYLTASNTDGFVPETVQFWLMVASLGHDVGHLGVNNQFLEETAHELALKYNDRSPMEMMHCALLFTLTNEPEADIFSQVEKDLYREMRKGIITVILHTDMVKHNEMIKELGLLYQMGSEAFDSLMPSTMVSDSQVHFQLVMNAILHCADISNPMKPWYLCQKIAYLCLEEFFAQGDLEKAKGIPVQMLNDREKVNKPNSQVGFIEFVITPMVEVVVSLFPKMDGLAGQLSSNVQQWAKVWQEESNPNPDAVVKVMARVQKVASRCQAVMREMRAVENCGL